VGTTITPRSALRAVLPLVGAGTVALRAVLPLIRAWTVALRAVLPLVWTRTTTRSVIATRSAVWSPVGAGTVRSSIARPTSRSILALVGTGTVRSTVARPSSGTVLTLEGAGAIGAPIARPSIRTGGAVVVETIVRVVARGLEHPGAAGRAAGSAVIAARGTAVMTGRGGTTVSAGLVAAIAGAVGTIAPARAGGRTIRSRRWRAEAPGLVAAVAVIADHSPIAETGTDRSRTKRPARAVAVVTGAAVGRPGHRHGFAGGDPAEQVDFLAGQGADLPSGQTFQGDRADGDAGQHHHLMTELGQHSPDLAVLPFGEDQFEDRRVPLLGHRADPLGPDLPLGEPDPLGQLIESGALGTPGDDDAVQLLDAELGVRELVGEFAVVGHDHQPDAHLVEPADGVDPLGDFRQEVEDARPSRRVVVRRDVALGLIDGEVDQAFLLDLLAIDRDGDPPEVDLGPEFLDDLTADGHAPLEDQLLTSPT